jgi:MFS family permease
VKERPFNLRLATSYLKPPKRISSTTLPCAGVAGPMSRSLVEGDGHSLGEESVSLSSSRPPRSLDDFLELASRPAPHTPPPYRYWLIFLSLGLANSSDASEILCLSYILSEKRFEDVILHDEAWRKSLLAAAVFLGMLMGGLFVGALGDWHGRRPMLLVGLTTNSVAGLLSALATDAISLSALRLVAGIGIGATVPPLFTLCSELAPPADRGFWVTVAASFWMVGSIYVAIIGWTLLGNGASWRVFAAACALPSAFGCVMVYRFVPESPRFLAMRGDHERAVAVAQYLADSMNYVGSRLRQEELLEYYPRHAGDTERRFPGDVSCWHQITKAFTTFAVSVTQLYKPQLQKTTWPLQMVWFSLSFGSYGLLTWINTLFVEVHLENLYLNSLLFALSNLPGNLLSAWLLDRTGRATLLVGSVIAAALSLLAFAYVAAQEASDSPSVSKSWIIVAACSFQCFTITAWNSIDVMTSELFPTTVRSTGMGLCAASGRVGAMLAQLVNGALVQNPTRLLIVAAITLLMGALTPALLPGGDQTGMAMLDRVAVVHEDNDEDSVLDVSLRDRVVLQSRQNQKHNEHGYNLVDSVVSRQAHRSTSMVE